VADVAYFLPGARHYHKTTAPHICIFKNTLPTKQKLTVLGHLPTARNGKRSQRMEPGMACCHVKEQKVSLSLSLSLSLSFFLSFIRKCKFCENIADGVLS
jgi:hypothetical protein